MNGAARTSTRDIARAAVRAELAQVAFDLFLREGFDKVTINDLAAAAGVSRSTFLRYFGSKEEAALSAFDAQGDLVADALRARPADEDDWTALRRALDTVIEHYHQDPAGALATTRLVQNTPALCARHLEKQHGWRPTLAQALAERAGAPQPPPLALSVKAAAALDCLNIAIDHWTASDGRLHLVDLLDEAFAALAPR
ncbi:TetR family transcriptional regulator [Nonomuraea sp. H19]|uniref:TetR family transcriptional regulator n=1 Tax=Nonomuraea sp. H19 TaxID=3452206 RepID=UPI003F887B35